jgi:hypothetical protein
MKAQQSDSARIGADVVEAFNQSDWGRLRACLSDNVIYEETGTGRRVTGADEYVELCRGWKQAFADVAGTIQRSVANDDLAALERFLKTLTDRRVQFDRAPLDNPELRVTDGNR